MHTTVQRNQKLRQCEQNSKEPHNLLNLFVAFFQKLRNCICKLLTTNRIDYGLRSGVHFLLHILMQYVIVVFK